MLRQVETVLKDIAKRLRAVEVENLVSVRAFGSRVRGDHTGWSDFDVLVVVRDRTPNVEKEIINIFVEEEDRFGLSFTPVIKDLRSFEMEEKFHTPFYEAVTKEGVSV